MLDIVITVVYVLAVISGLIFLLLLFKIIYDKLEQAKNDKLREELKEIVNNYLAGREVDLTVEFSARQKELLEEIIIDYLQQIKGETKRQLKDLAEKCGVVDFKIKQLINSKQWWKKSEAAYRLGELGSKKAVSALLDSLHESNSDIRYQSALAIVKISTNEHLPVVINKLLESDFYPREVILRLIEEVDESIYNTMESLITDDDIEKRIIAVQSLGLKQDYRVLKWIKKYIRSSVDSLVEACLKAAYYLGDLGDNDYFQLLLTTKSHPTPEVRANLARVLEKFRSNESRRELQNLMTDTHWKVRYNAAQSLLNHGGQGLLALSKQLHSSDRFAQDMAWQILHREIIFNKMLKEDKNDDYEQIKSNVKDYLVANNKEGVKDELENYFD